MTRSRSALLVMDMLVPVLGGLDEPTRFVDSVATAIEGARAHQIPVIHVRVGFRDGYPEVADSNLTFTRVRAAGRLLQSDPANICDSRVAPVGDEIVTVKRRVGAFAGSDLELILRASEVDHLVLCGLYTSGVVLSTVRHAADLDFRLTVLSDGCADPDPSVHDMLVAKVFPAQAEVTTVDSWLAALPERLADS